MEQIKKKKQTTPLKLNIGCGYDIREGYVNIDKYVPVADVQADILHLPYEDGVAEEAVLSHVIEHVSWRLHLRVFEECFRVLEEGGTLILAYPEFSKCVDMFLTNKDGRRWQWWVQTLFGSQTSEGQYHVAPMVTDHVIDQLTDIGFKDFEVAEDGCDTVLRCKKGKPKNWH